MKKYALLSYILPRSFSSLLPGPQSKAPVLVSIMRELGYEVDIIAFHDLDFKSSRRYDLFIGHGGKNWDYLCKTVVKPNATKIYFAAGIYWKEFNRLEKERFVKRNKK